ncbi:MAG: hypothetical protein COT43_03430 [Candidatus Marinimicrobia bacterium CG08_land_8_20_14_0_20_45_22]|nr:MAG: hypothetical protein COT43_03430 [Candidatus Marinimicrobia bacterium CG08_land_8_20_14_0_20_45_22]
MEPVNGQLSIELLNVEITFDYNEEEISVFNKNWNSARVTISRRESWGEYLEIYDRRILGRVTSTSTAYFESGDRIKVKIQTQNDQGEEITKESYFELG